jgi:hypothetical protein
MVADNASVAAPTIWSSTWTENSNLKRRYGPRCRSAPLAAQPSQPTLFSWYAPHLSFRSPSSSLTLLCSPSSPALVLAFSRFSSEAHNQNCQSSSITRSLTCPLFMYYIGDTQPILMWYWCYTPGDTQAGIWCGGHDCFVVNLSSLLVYSANL